MLDDMQYLGKSPVLVMVVMGIVMTLLLSTAMVMIPSMIIVMMIPFMIIVMTIIIIVIAMAAGTLMITVSILLMMNMVMGTAVVIMVRSFSDMDMLLFYAMDMRSCGFTLILIVMSLCMHLLFDMTMFLRIHMPVNMAMLLVMHMSFPEQILHIMILVFVGFIQNNMKVADIQPRLFHPADLYTKSMDRNTLQRLFQHFPVRAQIQQCRHRHISADPAVAFQI